MVLRVALGLCLFIKGISFLNNTLMLDQLLAGSVMSNSVEWLPLVITSAHLLGGFLIIIGLLTRWAILLQIPILIGAVIFIGRKQGLANSGSELVFALVILVLLIIFFFEGGGPISLDNYFKKHPV